MKITKRQLARLIREELEIINELKTVPARWWEYEPEDVMTDLYHQQRQLPPTDPDAWERQWQRIKKQLEKRYPRK
jgi:hypothetical protein